ncbi:unnamed protein product, partial [Scytosiphon promiscuus]
MCPPLALRGDVGTGTMVSPEERGSRDRVPSPGRPALVLVALYNGMLDVVGDCETGVREGCGSAGPVETAATGVRGEAGLAVDTRSAILRSALVSFVEIFDDLTAISDLTSGEQGKTVRSNADRLWPGRLDRHDASPRPRECRRGTQGRRNGSLVSHEGGAIVAPFHQLLALRFLHEAVRRWPSRTVRLMLELGLWDVLFSQRFLSGGSWHISRAIEGAIEGRDEAHSHASATNGSSAPSDVPGDHAIGWGLVRDGTLLLLEAVVIVRCLLPFGRENLIQHPQEPKGGRRVGVRNSGPTKSHEIEQFVGVLTSSDGSRPCAMIALQGCRWLRVVISMESAFGSNVLLPSSVRVAVLRLAFRWCDHGNDARSDAWVSRKVGWPLVHSSLSLAMDVVRTSRRGVLFKTAVAYAMDDGRSSGEVVAPSGKSRAHRPTASMTSEASSPCLHPSSAWWASGSGGSQTPVSVNSLSPRAGRSFSLRERARGGHGCDQR